MNTLTIKLAGIVLLFLAIIGGAYGLYSTGHTKGYNLAIAEFAEKALVQLQEKEAKKKKAEEELLEVNVALETEKAKKKQVIKEVTRDVIQYVQVPDRTQCKLDADWLRIRESAIFIADPRSPPTR